MLHIRKKIREKIREWKKDLMAYAINDRIKYTFGRGTAYFGWRDRILVILIFVVLFGLIILLIIFYPKQ